MTDDFVRPTHRACQAQCAAPSLDASDRLTNNSEMWKYLRAWREHRNLSQEKAAAALGVRHSTISRWERGIMKLSTSDLEKLARLYLASVSQIQAPPEAAELVSRMDRAQTILSGLSNDDLERWLAIGESLARK